MVHGQCQRHEKAEESATRVETDHEDLTVPECRRGTRTTVQFDPQRMPSGTWEMEELNRHIQQESDYGEGKVVAFFIV